MPNVAIYLTAISLCLDTNCNQCVAFSLFFCILLVKIITKCCFFAFMVSSFFRRRMMTKRQSIQQQKKDVQLPVSFDGEGGHDALNCHFPYVFKKEKMRLITQRSNCRRTFAYTFSRKILGLCRRGGRKKHLTYLSDPSLAKASKLKV